MGPGSADDRRAVPSGRLRRLQPRAAVGLAILAVLAALAVVLVIRGAERRGPASDAGPRPPTASSPTSSSPGSPPRRSAAPPISARGRRPRRTSTSTAARPRRSRSSRAGSTRATSTAPSATGRRSGRSRSTPACSRVSPTRRASTTSSRPCAAPARGAGSSTRSWARRSSRPGSRRPSATRPRPPTAPVAPAAPVDVGPGGPGFTGDQAALQAALDATPPGGTVSLAPRAVVRISTPLRIPRGVTLTTTGEPALTHYASMGRLVRGGPPPDAKESSVVDLAQDATLSHVWVSGGRAWLGQPVRSAVTVRHPRRRWDGGVVEDRRPARRIRPLRDGHAVRRRVHDGDGAGEPGHGVRQRAPRARPGPTASASRARGRRSPATRSSTPPTSGSCSTASWAAPRRASSRGTGSSPRAVRRSLRSPPTRSWTGAARPLSFRGASFRDNELWTGVEDPRRHRPRGRHARVVRPHLRQGRRGLVHRQHHRVARDPHDQRVRRRRHARRDGPRQHAARAADGEDRVPGGPERLARRRLGVRGRSRVPPKDQSLAGCIPQGG